MLDNYESKKQLYDTSKIMKNEFQFPNEENILCSRVFRRFFLTFN